MLFCEYYWKKFRFLSINDGREEKKSCERNPRLKKREHGIKNVQFNIKITL